MEESFICECGNDKFWFFWNKVRCIKCHNEYKKTSNPYNPADKEIWMRRFNKDESIYPDKWEHSKVTYK